MEYNDKLNEVVDHFMANYKLDDITEKTVLDYFGGMCIYNQYGNIFHALVHHKYQPEKVFKMIEIFMNLENVDIDINYKGEYTGYHFIQLALYGYTVNGKDYSYTTNFILELIKLAKKYNLDVNTIDEDGDTIIHTALASEIYNGNTVPLLNELGLDFDIKKKDNQDNDIYNALLHYKKEALAGGNKTKKWLERLSNEESEIKTIVEKGNFTLEAIDIELDKIKVELERLEVSLSNNLFNTYNEIKKCIERLNYFLEKRKLFNLDNTIYHNLEEIINKKIIKAVNEYLKVLIAEPITEKIKELEEFLQAHSFMGELEILKERKAHYVKSINQLRNKINSSNSIADLIKIKESLDNFKDDIIKQELLSLIEQRENYFNEIIKNIESLMSKIELIENWCVTSGIICFEKTKEEEIIDFTVLDEKALLQYYQIKLNKFEQFKEFALTKFGELVDIINSFIQLTDNDILTLQELQDVKNEKTSKSTEQIKKKTMFEVLNGK